MRIDELRQELAELANTERPAGDVDAAVRSGRRRLVLLRALAASAVIVVAAALFVVTGVGRDDDRRGGVVVTPSVPTTPVTTPATTPSGPVPDSARKAAGLIFTSPAEGWVCADPLLHTADGGRTWQAVDYRSLPGTSGTHSCGASGHDAWILTGSAVVPVQGGTDVAGPVTLPALPASVAFTEITFAGPSRGWILATSERGRSFLYGTTNGLGFTLVSRNAPTTHVQFADGNNGWGIGGGELEQTTDGGATWQPVALPAPPPRVTEPGRFFNDLAVAGSTIVAAGGDPTGDFYTPFFDVSTDGGRSWERRNGPAQFARALGIDLAVVDADHWRVSSGTLLWLTDDGGRTWTSSRLPGQPGPAVSIAFPSAEVGWTHVGDRIIQTTDGGRTWHDVDTTPQRPWQTGLAAVPNECPADSTTPAPVTPHNTAAATDAALEFVRRTRGWIGPHPSDETVPVSGPTDRSGYAGILQLNVPKYCGRAVAGATYSVTLNNASITLDDSRFTVLAVGHFAKGWRVWGFYR